MYMVIYKTHTAKVSRMNLQRTEGFFSAAPDCMASHIYTGNNCSIFFFSLPSSTLWPSLTCVSQTLNPHESIWKHICVCENSLRTPFTSLASFSSRAFLSTALKASSVLVLYSIPRAGQQRVGVGPSLTTRRIKLLK